MHQDATSTSMIVCLTHGRRLGLVVPGVIISW